MKAPFSNTRCLIAPCLVIALVGIWIARQRNAIATLQAEDQVLSNAIQSRAAVAPPRVAPLKPPTSPEKLDWKNVAAVLARLGPDAANADKRFMRDLHQRLRSMTREELVALLDEVESLDLSKETSDHLRKLLLSPMIAKDPELALTRFADQFEGKDYNVLNKLDAAMTGFVGEDADKAARWLDSQIAAGNFSSKALSGKNESRLKYEGLLIAAMLHDKFDTASARLSALPEAHRVDVMREFSMEPVRAEDQQAFAKLVRGSVPADEQFIPLGQQAGRIAGRDGYPGVTAFLENIAATNAERITIVESTAQDRSFMIAIQRKISREDVDAAREWASVVAPSSTAQMTGKILASSLQSSHRLDFQEAANLAFQYSREGDNGDALYYFLQNATVGQHKEEARILADQIVGDERRNLILQRLK